MLVECRSTSTSKQDTARGRVPVPLGRTLYKSRHNKLVVGALSHSAVLIKKLVTEVQREQVQPSRLLVTQAKDDDCKSMRSCHSTTSKVSVRSRRKESMRPTTQKVFYDAEQQQSAMLSKPALEEFSPAEMQKYLDGLLRERIQLMASLRNGQPANAQLVTDLNQKLEAVVQLLSEKNSEQSETRSNASMYRSIEGKISLVERILSENFVEADVLRSFYQLATYGRTEYGRLGASNSLSKYTRRELAPLMNERSPNLLDRSLLTKKSVNQVTVNATQECYQKPNRDDYNIFRQERPKYKFRQQAMPTSSYKENFLNYSGVMTMKPSNGHWEQHTLPTRYHSTTGSTYDRDFVPKSVQACNFRDLDSFKDKIRTLKLKYTQADASGASVSNELSKTMAKLEREYNTRPASKPQHTRSFEGQFTTVARREHNDKSKEQPMRSAPTDNRLHLMQRLYRMSYSKLP